MGVLITASLGGGGVVLRNREIEHSRSRSARLGEPHRCLIRFDRDTNHAEDLQDFQGQLSVEIVDDSILGGAKAVLFEGVMTAATRTTSFAAARATNSGAESPLLL